MLILTVAEDFDKLFEDSRLTAVAALSEFGRVMIVAVYVSLMFIVAVLGTKDGRAYGAGKMFDVVFAVECGDVGTTEGASTCMAEQVESAEVVRFAERVLIRRLFWNGEELGSDDFTAVLNTVSNCTEGRGSNARTWHVKHSRWYVPPRARTNWPVRWPPHFAHILLDCFPLGLERSREGEI
jgi:hypothetical protein